jgi:EmrB/QacA subfamily drug resistance transporter
MYSIDTTAVAVAFPHFIDELGTNVLWAAWTISIYLVAVTSVMPLMGTLSDSLGRKKIFLISLVMFTASSLACSLASNIYGLIVFRFFQGIGGASFLPTAAGIVSDQFPDHRERAIGLFTSIFPIGGIVGPNLGGWIVSRYSWRYIFFINLPIGIMLIAMILWLLKESKAPTLLHIDIRGAISFFAATLFLMLGLNRMAQSFSLLAFLFLMISFALFYMFLQHEKRELNPILDIPLLRSTPFLAANLYNLIFGAGVMGIFAFIPLYATSVYNLSTLASGMILTPRSLAVIPASTLTSFLLRRWGYRQPMLIGLVMIASSTMLLGGPGVFLLQKAGIHFGAAGMLAILVMITGLGMGIALPASNNACIELMPDKVATITGLRGMFRSVGGALGISLITMILHLSPTPAKGFMITFIAFGLGLLCSLPLVFLMPDGKHVSLKNKSNPKNRP